MKNVKSAGLWPMPSAPCRGLSFTRVRRCLYGSYPMSCGCYEWPRGDYLDVPAKRCGIFPQVFSTAEDISRSLQGVGLDAVDNADRNERG